MSNTYPEGLDIPDFSLVSDELLGHSVGCICRDILGGNRHLCPICALALNERMADIQLRSEYFLELAVEDFVKSEVEEGRFWDNMSQLVLLRAYETAWPKFSERFDREQCIKFLLMKRVDDGIKNLMSRLGFREAGPGGSPLDL